MLSKIITKIFSFLLVGFSLNLLFFTFQTKAQECLTPQNVTLASKTNNQVTVRWNPIDLAEKFEIVYHINGKPETQTITIPKAQYTVNITGLMADTDYEACLTAFCKSADTLIMSTTECISFRTCPAVPIPTSLTGLQDGGQFCVNNNKQFALSGSPAGGVFSGPGVVGSNFTPATAGAGTHTIIYTLSQAGCISTAKVTVMVVNQTPAVIKGVKEGEKFCKLNNFIPLLASPPGGNYFIDGVPSNNFIAPAQLTVGEHELSYNPPNTECALSSKVNFQVVDKGDFACEEFISCPAPMNLKGTMVKNANAALLMWSSTQESSIYQVSIRLKGTNLWKTVFARTNSAAIQGLIPNSLYEARVRAVCGKTKTSEWSPIVDVMENTPCMPPLGSTVGTKTKNSVQLSWTSSSSATKYYVIVKQTDGNGSEIVYSTTSTNITLRNLKSNTTYEYKIKTSCEDGTKSLANSKLTFKTL